MTRALVELGPTQVICEVARTAREQARGLQGRSTLKPDEGMFFPFSPTRAATFHMGTVAFPIDLVFADGAGRVARVVHEAQPGSHERWSHPVCSAVIEVRGGTCRREAVRLGDYVRIAGRRVGQQTYNLLRTLTDGDEMPRTDGMKPDDALPPGGAERGLAPSESWVDRRMPADQPGLASDKVMPHFEQDMGWWREPDSLEGIRPLARRGVVDVELDVPEFATVMLEAAARAGVPWEPVVLNARIERAVVSPHVIGRWLHDLGLDEGQRSAAHNVAASSEGLQAIGDGFVASGLADLAQVVGHDDYNALVLTRGKRPRGSR